MIDGFSFKDVYGIGDLLQIMQCLRSEGGCHGIGSRRMKASKKI